MTKEWHDINIPGYGFGKKQEEPEKSKIIEMFSMIPVQMRSVLSSILN